MVLRNGYIKMDKTINYYNQHAQEFCENTKNADMSHVLEKFIAHLPQNALILDAGCGSGRDSKYFLGKGFQVEAFDASEELCKIASEHIGQEVKCMTFQEMTDANKYDGIWACASLLHVCKAELPDVMKRLVQALKENGVLYVSFKYGDGEREKDGRFFNDYNEENVTELLNETGVQVLECFVTGDVRSGRGDEMWVNAIGRKCRYTKNLI